jgi:hypothetical protein
MKNSRYQPLLAFALTAASLLFAGCVPSEFIAVSEKQDALDSLNRRDYQRAIAVLEQLQRRDPDDQEVKILLASAYGGSVGLNVVDSFSAFGPLLFDSSEKSDKSAGLKLVQQDPGSVLPTPDKVVRFFTQYFESLGDGAALYFNMPYTTREARPRLVSAILLTQTVPKESLEYDRAQALAVLLYTAQFLNYLRDAFPGLQVENPNQISMSQLACSIQPLSLAENLRVATEYAGQGIESWRVVTSLRGLPFKPNMEKALAQSKELLEYLKDHQGAAVVADVISNRLRKQFCE